MTLFSVYFSLGYSLYFRLLLLLHLTTPTLSTVNCLSASVSGFVFVFLLCTTTILPHILWAIYYCSLLNPLGNLLYIASPCLLSPFTLRRRLSADIPLAIHTLHPRILTHARHFICLYPLATPCSLSALPEIGTNGGESITGRNH